MYTGNMDLGTLMLYLAMGVIACICMKCAKRTDGELQISKIALPKRYIVYAVFVVIFACFAAFRKVDVKLGGADAKNYADYFLYAWDKESEVYSLIPELLFRWYCQLFRLLTDNYKIFFWVSYGFVAVCYCVFIEKYCAKESAMMPFLLIVFLYLKAFCTLRSSMAVAVLLLALVCLDKNKWVAILLAICTVFIHRMSVAYVALPLFYILLGKPIKKLSGWKLAAAVFLVGALGIIAARLVQLVIVSYDLLQGKNMWYLRKSIGVSLWSRFPMYFAHFLLYICMAFFVGKVKASDTLDKLKVFCCYDLVVMPATIVLGFWRANEYLYLARLCMWGLLIPKAESVFLMIVQWASEKGKLRCLKRIDKAIICLVYKVGISAAVLMWLVFRIYSEWDDLKIMPYVLQIK